MVDHADLKTSNGGESWEFHRAARQPIQWQIWMDLGLMCLLVGWMFLGGLILMMMVDFCCSWIFLWLAFFFGMIKLICVGNGTMDYLVGVFCERPGGSDCGSMFFGMWDWYLFMNVCLFFWYIKIQNLTWVDIRGLLPSVSQEPWTCIAMLNYKSAYRNITHLPLFYRYICVPLFVFRGWYPKENGIHARCAPYYSYQWS